MKVQLFVRRAIISDHVISVSVGAVRLRGYPLAEPADNLDDPDRATAAEKRVADSLARLLD